MTHAAGNYLVVEGLHKRLGARRILEDVAFAVEPGELAVITGDNGSGKSTLLRILAGVVEADRGRATLWGQPLLGDGFRARRDLGYMPDSAAPLPDLRVGELCELVQSLKGAKLEAERGALSERLGVAPLLSQRTSSLSLGQRRRLCLLLALLGGPSLLLLDEPSDGFDPGGVAMVVRLLHERAAAGRGALVTSNDEAFLAALGGSRYRIERGRLARRFDLPAPPGEGGAGPSLR